MSNQPILDSEKVGEPTKEEVEEEQDDEETDELETEEELDEGSEDAAIMRPMRTYDPCPPDCEICKSFPGLPKMVIDPADDFTEEELDFADKLLSEKRQRIIPVVVVVEEEPEEKPGEEE